MNILFSSTRQWNPGDEFIFFGVRNLIEDFFQKKINWVLYDRNPDLFVSVDNRFHKEVMWSNSSCGDHSEVYNLAIIAGSPEWTGKPLINFYKAVNKYKLDCIILGVGYIDSSIQFNLDEIGCFKDRTQLITVRDEFAARELNKIGVNCEVLPCPALFASKKEFPISSIKKIGFIIQTDKTSNQAISEELKYACICILKELRQRGMDVEVICNYIDEFEEYAKKLAPIRYSYDAADYINILADYNLIISTRLHGAILANSLGKQAILINAGNSRLSGAVARFPYIINTYPNHIVDNVFEAYEKSLSDEIKNWKVEIGKQYLALFTKHLKYNALN